MRFLAACFPLHLESPSRLCFFFSHILCYLCSSSFLVLAACALCLGRLRHVVCVLLHSSASYFFAQVVYSLHHLIALCSSHSLLPPAPFLILHSHSARPRERDPPAHIQCQAQEHVPAQRHVSVPHAPHSGRHSGRALWHVSDECGVSQCVQTGCDDKGSTQQGAGMCLLVDTSTCTTCVLFRFTLMLNSISLRSCRAGSHLTFSPLTRTLNTPLSLARSLSRIHAPFPSSNMHSHTNTHVQLLMCRNACVRCSLRGCAATLLCLTNEFCDLNAVIMRALFALLCVPAARCYAYARLHHDVFPLDLCISETPSSYCDTAVHLLWLISSICLV